MITRQCYLHNVANYQLTIFSNQVTGNGVALDGDGNGTAGGDFQTPATRPATGDALRLFRLFGDVNGDATVNGFDLGAFRAAFGSVTGDAGYKSYLDFDGLGAINGLDLGQFRARFGVTLPP